ncbi:hypothetical protein L7750_17390 [Xenorhabdus bovienii]|uniref:hypothetical protein n=1 Tax=Xenorhabdus bovienii TaxID=40576 RepID=UPI001EDF9BDC|nr:hypothetical protein [Xenorhabdus bovienii]MCG3472088.1 hypothetical protein [Xenorhabdus bovienii]
MPAAPHGHDHQGADRGEGVQLAQAALHDMAINAEHVAIVNKLAGIFGKKGKLWRDLTGSLKLGVYPVFILRVASQRSILMMESCAGWR